LPWLCEILVLEYMVCFYHVSVKGLAVEELEEVEAPRVLRLVRFNLQLLWAYPPGFAPNLLRDGPCPLLHAAERAWEFIYSGSRSCADLGSTLAA